MIGLPGCARIFLRRDPTDMRKGFGTLAGLVEEAFGRDAADGSLFVFVNRDRTTVKVLCWDRDGFVIWSKRLARGCFILPEGGDAQIGIAELTLLLEGVRARVLRRSPRWSKPA